MADQLEFDLEATRQTLFEAFLQARDKYGKGTECVEDIEHQPLTYQRVVLGALILGDKLAQMTTRGEAVGVFLPNVQGTVVTLMGLSLMGRVPAMLNFSAGLKNLRSAVATAEIRTIVTSRRFIETAQLEDIIKGLKQDNGVSGARIVYLEDVRTDIGALDKVKGLMRSRSALKFHRSFGVKPDDAAIILFTSGSEGSPKGVVLSHANLVANVMQIAVHGGDRFNSSQIIMNPLPMFHSYGLTAGTLLGLFHGMKVVLYPSPLHYREIPKFIAKTKATVLFGTDTFLRGYARSASAGSLDSIDLVVTGAERVKDDNFQTWSEFGTTILEGYGATECAPVVACCQPDKMKRGTVGPLLAGMEWRLEPVEGIDEGGRLVVRGPNVMKGYLFADQPGVLQPPEGGWHDTGDIVEVDEDGIVSIKGRAKRFAKIGGEMVSLAAVEMMVAEFWEEDNHVVLSQPHPKKGEQLLLVTDKSDAERAPLIECARVKGLPELWVPRSILIVPEIPVMGTGKVDLVSTERLVTELAAE